VKVLVTGHKGFIGQNICKTLQNKGWDLSTFDILDNPILRPKDLDYTGLDCVIHLGAISSTTETNVNKIMDLNLSWSIELFEMCKQLNIQFQFASSASLYGNQYRTPMKETDELNPLNYYAMSKYLFEKYVEKSKHANIVQIFRYFNVYGPNEDHKGGQASPYTQFTKQAKETGKIKIFEGSENYYRDFIHVNDVANIQLKMLNKYTSGTFNVGSASTKSFLDVAKIISNEYCADIITIPFPEHLKPHYQYYTCADMTKLEKILL
jgi:ADP-L-glycero-D-manno-heptose 6-epimerase